VARYAHDDIERPAAADHFLRIFRQGRIIEDDRVLDT